MVKRVLYLIQQINKRMTEHYVNVPTPVSRTNDICALYFIGYMADTEKQCQWIFSGWKRYAMVRSKYHLFCSQTVRTYFLADRDNLWFAVSIIHSSPAFSWYFLIGRHRL